MGRPQGRHRSEGEPSENGADDAAVRSPGAPIKTLAIAVFVFWITAAFAFVAAVRYGITGVGYLWEVAGALIVAVGLYMMLTESAYIRRVARGLRCAFTQHRAAHDPISYHDNDTILRIDMRCERCGCGGTVDLAVEKMQDAHDAGVTFLQPFGPGRGY